MFDASGRGHFDPQPQMTGSGLFTGGSEDVAAPATCHRIVTTRFHIEKSYAPPRLQIPPVRYTAALHSLVGVLSLARQREGPAVGFIPLNKI